MTDDEAKALGLRALAAGFRWAPGVLYRTGHDEYHEAWRCFAPPARNIVGDGIGPWFVNGVGDVYSMEEESAPLALIYHPWPDFRDPATLGVLLALVREACEPHRGSDYIASTMHTGTGWGVRARYGSEGLATIVECVHETEAHALVAALEAAP
jgi:hypothetical protein